MSKISSIILLSITLTYYSLFSQHYTDSIYNAQDRLRVRKFIKYNDEEKLCEFYENDTLRLKLIGTFDQFNSWSIETVLKETHYLNGHIKSTGSFLVVKTKNTVWPIPVNRQVYYRRNGEIKVISNFSHYGVPIYDSIFNKNGTINKAILYTN